MKKKPEIVEHELFKVIGQCGDQLKMETFVVGGWVRDNIIGRKNTYHCFFVIGTLLYLSIPFIASAVSVSPSIMFFVMFLSLIHI